MTTDQILQSLLARFRAWEPPPGFSKLISFAEVGSFGEIMIAVLDDDIEESSCLPWKGERGLARLAEDFGEQLADLAHRAIKARDTWTPAASVN